MLEVGDVAAWEEFATQIVGLTLGGGETGRWRNLRMDEQEQRLQLVRGRADDLGAAGWDLRTAAALEEFVSVLRARGLAVHAENAQLAAQRAVEKLYVLEGADGLRHELFHGARPAADGTPFRSAILRSGFRTGPLGVGHFLHNAPDYRGSVAFYTDTLGLRVSDYIHEKDFMPGIDVDATFLHAAAGRHHSVAVARLPTDKRVHHLMLELMSLDDVGFAVDRCEARKIRLAHGLGHHPNDRSTSCYIETPSGFALEMAWGAVVVTNPDTWTISTYPKLSDWGHRYSPVAGH